MKKIQFPKPTTPTPEQDDPFVKLDQLIRQMEMDQRRDQRVAVFVVLLMTWCAATTWFLFA